jgi:predicted flap endonuclease-1-like 5' DNA nuclease
MRRLAADLAERAELATRLGATLAAREETIGRLEAELGELRARGPASGDDLKRIKGIGPGFEKALRAAGIDSFQRIAAWTDADIEQIAPKLKVHASRIRRENWVGGAASLLGIAPPPGPLEG